jgi:hypothetical protein
MSTSTSKIASRIEKIKTDLIKLTQNYNLLSRVSSLSQPHARNRRDMYANARKLLVQSSSLFAAQINEINRQEKEDNTPRRFRNTRRRLTNNPLNNNRKRVKEAKKVEVVSQNLSKLFELVKQRQVAFSDSLDKYLELDGKHPDYQDYHRPILNASLQESAEDYFLILECCLNGVHEANIFINENDAREQSFAIAQTLDEFESGMKVLEDGLEKNNAAARARIRAGQKVFVNNLSLSSAMKEIHDRYDATYRGYHSGFFGPVKGKIKSFFQKSSRSQTLAFIDTLANCTQIDDKTRGECLKLILDKISTEHFGKPGAHTGSSLYRIVYSALEESGVEPESELSFNASISTALADNDISVPEHLQKHLDGITEKAALTL